MKLRPKQSKSNLSWLTFLRDKLLARKINRLFVFLIVLSYLLTVLITLLVTQRGIFLFQPPIPLLGSVAAEDITVDRDIYYVDVEATRLRREARGKLVPPVFILNDEIALRSLDAYKRFLEIYYDTARRAIKFRGTSDRENTERTSPTVQPSDAAAKGQAGSILEQKSLEEMLVTNVQFVYPMIAGKFRQEDLASLSSNSFSTLLCLIVYSHSSRIFSQILGMSSSADADFTI